MIPSEELLKVAQRGRGRAARVEDAGQPRSKAGTGCRRGEGQTGAERAAGGRVGRCARRLGWGRHTGVRRRAPERGLRRQRLQGGSAAPSGKGWRSLATFLAPTASPAPLSSLASNSSLFCEVFLSQPFL